ncbi:MAG: hypothetical protein R3E66_09205 [bacterium]
MKTLGVVFVGIFCVLATGCKKTCYIPEGAYTMSLKANSGDCSEQIVAQFDGYSDSIEIPKASECRRFVTTVDGEASGCLLIMDISADVDGTEFHDGTGIFKVTCDDGYTCRHTFDVAFERMASTP